MSEGTIFITEKVCPQCRKNFTVLYPGEWVYKRGRVGHVIYLCSWKCLQAFDKETKGDNRPMSGKRIVTDENRREAVQIAIKGGDPRPYLAGLGIKATDNMWHEIKSKLKAEDPDTYELLPPKIPARNQAPKKPEIPEKPVQKIETPETPRITKPVNYGGFNVREVEGNFARYRRSDVGGSTYIDVEIEGGSDTLSYTIEQWRSFRKEHDRAAVILGVEM